jgi:hypothetical protein
MEWSAAYARQFHCSHNPHTSSTRKATMTAISATLAIVFMASPHAPTLVA